MSPGYVTFSVTYLEEKIVSGEQKMWLLEGAGGSSMSVGMGMYLVNCKRTVS